MDAQLEQAVSIALQGSADAALKQQAIQFCNEVKDSDDGWQLCLALFTGGSVRSDESRFFALQVIDSKLPSLSADQVQFVRANLFPFVQKAVSSRNDSILGPAHLKNKVSQTLAYLFVLCYLGSWTSFFDDFMQLMATANSPVGNALAVDIYLRVLRIIHEEIGENIYQRSTEQTKHNNLLKDRIRESEVRKLTNSWMLILEAYSQTTDGGGDSDQKLRSEIIDGVLKVIGGWVSWIDISLIVTPAYLNQIFSRLMDHQQRITACDTISEIVLKKMKPGDKLELISLLNLTNVIAQLPMQSTEDIDFIERVAKLANCVGVELLHVFDGTTSALSGVNPTSEEEEKAEQMLITMFPTIFEFLSHEYDDVTKQVLPLIAEYLQFIRRESKKAKAQVDTANMAKNQLGKVIEGFPRDSEFVAPQRAAFLRTILERVLLKMKYDSESQWEEEEDDDESEFLELRSKLKVYLDHIASIDVDMFIDGMASVITESLVNVNGKSWQDVELGMYCLFVLGDSVKNGSSGSNKVIEARTTSAVNELFLKMVQSDVVLAVNHASIQKWYMELVLKHSASLTQNEPVLVQKVLEMFVSPIGIRNEVESVRVRSWYLLYKFVKCVKHVVGDIAETVYNAIEKNGLLVIKAKLPTNDGDNNGSYDNDTYAESQRYLYELCGLLFGMTADQELGLTLTQSLLRPLYADVERGLSVSNLFEPLNVLQIHHDLYALGTFVRGFNDNLASVNKAEGAAVPKATVEVKNIAQVVGVVMERLADPEPIRDACRFVYSFLIASFGMDLLEDITRFITVMLSKCSEVEMTDFLGFLGQLAHNFKTEQRAFEMNASLITPLEDRVVMFLNKATDGSTDFYVNQMNLRRAYLQFLQSILNNGMGSIFLVETNQQTFGTVLDSLLHYAGDTSDVTSAKLALAILNKMLLIWASGVVKSDPPEQDSFGKGMEVKQVFTRSFIFEHYTRLCWEVAASTGVGKNDASARVIVSEMAVLQKTLYEQTGMEYCTYLGEKYFPSVGFSQDMLSQYLEQLTTAKTKEFKKYFVQLIGYLTTQ